MTEADTELFAGFVATLGRGPGKSRALTREEAREAFAMVLAGRADPLQVGAFLMLLRYRGEDAAEITGLVEAARDAAGLPGPAPIADLDWPSYGAGRTRIAPWFLLSALALARSGIAVLMHGSNEFAAGLAVEAALATLAIAPAHSLAQAERALRGQNFAYVPIAALAPSLHGLLGMRRLFGLRSPVNTVARLLNPGDAPAGVDGVFHPAYLDVHMGVAALMHRANLVVLKGGGGEAERNAAKPAAVHVWRQATGRSVIEMPPYSLSPAPAAAGTIGPGSAGTAFGDLWRSDAAAPPGVLVTILATIALGLIATGRSTAATADADAQAVWSARH